MSSATALHGRTGLIPIRKMAALGALLPPSPITESVGFPTRLSCSRHSGAMSEMVQTLPSDGGSANDRSRTVSGSPSVGHVFPLSANSGHSLDEGADQMDPKPLLAARRSRISGSSPKADVGPVQRRSQAVLEMTPT